MHEWENALSAFVRGAPATSAIPSAAFVKTSRFGPLGYLHISLDYLDFVVAPRLLLSLALAS
jgi:hypothetical protein